jgi:protein involved in polysaccharide export with SLBB domain
VLANAGGALPTSAGEVLIARAHGPRNTMAPPAPRGSGDPVAGQDAHEGDPFEVVRIDLSRLQAGALELDVEIRDHDTVLVPRAESAYVLGEVSSPGAYPVQRTTTLEQLLSLAGGLSADAAQGRISVKRDGKTLRNVRLSDLVRPGDTIQVPARFF